MPETMAVNEADTDPLSLPDLLRSSILSAADEAKSLGRLPVDLVEQLRKAGAFRLLTPREYGGFETSLATALRVYEMFGRIDTSVGWNIWNHNFGYIAAFLDEAGANRVWAETREPIFANCSHPMGRAVEVPGGYRLSGRWKMVSGIDEADWLVAPGIVEDGEPARRTGNEPEFRLLLVPREQVVVHDTWNVNGMRASGSKDIEVDDAYVPSDLAWGAQNRTRFDRPLFHVFGVHLVVPGCTAVLLGTAQSAIDELVALAPNKKTQGGGTLAGRAHTQMEVARSETALHAARELLLRIAADFDLTAAQRGKATLRQQAALRAAQSHAASVSRAVLTAMHELGSSDSIYLGSRLERLVRDGLVAAQHANHSARHFEEAGRVRLGQA